MTAILCIAFCGVLLSGPVARGHWHDNVEQVKQHLAHHSEGDETSVDELAGCYLTPKDVWLASEYYHQGDRSMPSPRQRKLYRADHLPLDWELRLEALPVHVDRRLTPLARGLRRALLDGHLVVYDVRTEVVVDVVALYDL
jgi:hypothetical protein